MRSVLVHQQVEAKLLPVGEAFLQICIYCIKKKKVILTWENEELCIHAANDSYDRNSGNESIFSSCN